MRVMKQRGFTIIEVMLFLAISGLLTAGIMIGTGVAINAQRYKDAVATLQSDIQQQFEDAVAIKNDREGSDSSFGCGGERGQSNCVLMGKLMTIDTNGAVTQRVVYGNEPSALDDSATELQTVSAYAPSLVPVALSAQSTTLEWGTGAAQPVSILVVRSPRSGLVYTFTREFIATNNTQVQTMITEANRSARRVICITTRGGWTVSSEMSIVIASRASSPSAVEVRTADMPGGTGC